MADINSVLTDLEARGEALVNAIRAKYGEDDPDAAWAAVHVIEPSSEADILAAEEATGFTFPADFRAFLLRGFKSFEANFEDFDTDDDDHNYASAGIDFVSPDIMVRDIESFRDLAQYYEGATERVVKTGVPISFSEPHLVLTHKGVHLMLYDGEADVSPITATFTEFMQHWGAAAFYKSHSFKLYWARVGPMLDEEPPENNAWLDYLGRLYHW